MEMILPDTIQGWGGVDLENATLDDFRPLHAIMRALEERGVAVGEGSYYWGDYNHIDTFPHVTTGYQNAPTIWFLHRRIAQEIYDLAEHFINPEPALSFGINHGQDFPQNFTRFDVANSDHPCAVLPIQGSTADTPGALAAYRRFLADVKFWLGRFRYVYARRLGATRRVSSSGSAWNGQGSLAADFAANMEIRDYRGRFGNGSEIYEAERSQSGNVWVYYDNDDQVVETEEREWESASASEFSGVWVGNRCPIPADVIGLWGYNGAFLNETLSHPGFYEEYEKRGAEREYRVRAEGLWRSNSQPTRETKRQGEVFVETRWTYSPEGTQSKTTEREWGVTPPDPGWMLYDETRRKEYAGEGWDHAADSRTDFGTVEGGGNLILLPEKSSIDLPPAPEDLKPGGAGKPWRERDWGSQKYVGPITLHVVLDYGPHYRFP